MRWHPKPQYSGRILLVCDTYGLSDFDFKGFDGAKIGVDVEFPGANALYISDASRIEVARMPVVYTNDKNAEWMGGVRCCSELFGIETQTAAIMLATWLGASEVVVIGSDFEGSSKVVNANPDTGGCHPCSFGISVPPDRYGTFRSSPVDLGFGAIPRFCEGERVFILGGGPSVRGLDLTKLEGEIVIGVNDSYRLPNVGFLYFGDHRWGISHFDDLMQFKGQIWTTTHVVHPKVVKIMPAGNRFSDDNSRVAVLGNSGFGAMNIAALGGAATIILLGFDMCLVDGQANWHNDNINAPEDYHYRIYQQTARQLAIDIQRAFPDLVVLNANPLSAMQSFEKIHPNDVIDGLEKEVE